MQKEIKMWVMQQREKVGNAKGDKKVGNTTEGKGG